MISVGPWARGRLDGDALEGPALIQRLGEIATAYGIGRNIHVGETALGIKGRIGFEAGAALLLIGAHRELEKLVLTKWQAFWKDQLAVLRRPAARGPVLRSVAAGHRGPDHELAGAGDWGDPGAPGARAVSCRRHPQPALHDGQPVATYGEENRLWTGDEARAFARIAAVPSLLAAPSSSAGRRR